MEACTGSDTDKTEHLSCNGHTNDACRHGTENRKYCDKNALRQEKRIGETLPFISSIIKNEKERNNNHTADFHSPAAGHCSHVLYWLRNEESEGAASGGSGQETESSYMRAS